MLFFHGSEDIFRMNSIQTYTSFIKRFKITHFVFQNDTSLAKAEEILQKWKTEELDRA